MNILDQNYSNTDIEYNQINDFLRKLSKTSDFLLWESCRFNFWRYNIHAYKKKTDIFFKENVHIWKDENNSIIGLVISEYGKNDIFIEVHSDYLFIYPKIIQWINEVWGKNKSAIEIDIYADDREKIKLLESYRYTFKGHFENKRMYDLKGMDLNYNLKPGYEIKNLKSLENKSNRVSLVWNAFNNKKFSLENVNGLISSPDYNYKYDLSVVEISTQLQIAYCIGWKDKENENLGYIEPVGTHKEFRKQGFAKALIKACFKEMLKDGIHTIEIASGAEPDVSNYLYDSLNPTYKRKVYKYKHV